MSLRGLPFQFLNLGGEMMYIIDQRLHAQIIPQDRADKVRNDILTIMLNKSFVDELFKPQPLYTRDALRTVFTKLAHASIMRLNQSSMDKLYDLMIMAIKQQIVAAPQPRDLILITLNHLDSLRYYATSSTAKNHVDTVISLFIQTYAGMSLGELADVRHSLLSFLQDLNVRVSVFLKENLQNTSGRFILPLYGAVPGGVEVPGAIKYYNHNGEVHKIVHFPCGGNYSSSSPPGSLNPHGDRGIELGTNMYTRSTDTHYNTSKCSLHRPTVASTSQHSDYKQFERSSQNGREELNLLLQLIGSSTQAINDTSRQEFRLNLFDSSASLEQEDSLTSETFDDGIIRIDGGRRGTQPELGKILGELRLGEEDSCDPTVAFSGEESSSFGGEDLLNLLDSVN